MKFMKNKITYKWMPGAVIMNLMKNITLLLYNKECFFLSVTHKANMEFK